jgi:hypothetical protein
VVVLGGGVDFMSSSESTSSAIEELNAAKVHSRIIGIELTVSGTESDTRGLEEEEEEEEEEEVGGGTGRAPVTFTVEEAEDLVVGGGGPEGGEGRAMIDAGAGADADADDDSDAVTEVVASAS